MNLSILLFLIGILGFILNRKNIILMIIAIEIMLLAVTLLVLISSYGFDDNVGQTFSIYIISIAGAESVIGLSILVAYYRLRGTISGLLGRKVGVTGSQIVTCGSLIICSILISVAFYEVGLCGSPVYINLGTWLDSEILHISWEFYFDQLTVSLGLAVIYCSTLIHIYTIDYLSADPHCQRFFSYLSAFTGCMLILICGGNYLVMFVGWEGIGVVSYLLINFYFTRIQANKAAILAFTMNRGGAF
jgi:NADH-ubiquinone oxidoreductase chain 5